uniref:Uncharacterized protein n=1 Tax=Lepeophtheirus salmonis TaxID=72036 RepID=A0A0K2VFC7_LEPSM
MIIKLDIGIYYEDS